jgi:hypothetical protein
MCMGYNPAKSTWLNPDIEYLFNDEIIEYDMRDAGFSIIRYFKLLPLRKIGELASIDKDVRVIEIGKLQRDDKEFSKMLLDYFAVARSMFIEANDLSDNQIISVKKDAIYVIGKCNKTTFGCIEFAPKNTYSSYVRFSDNMNIEIYYSSNTLDVKGIGDSAVNRHRLYMLDFIKKIIGYIETKNMSVKRYLLSFINDYKSMSLDEEYYVEFNNISREMNVLFNFQKVLIPLTLITIGEVG